MLTNTHITFTKATNGHKSVVSIWPLAPFYMEWLTEEHFLEICILWLILEEIWGQGSNDIAHPIKTCMKL